MIGDLFDSPWKILIVAVVLIVLFGSKKLPDAARSLGKSMRILKTEVQDLHHEDKVETEQPGHPAHAPSPPSSRWTCSQQQLRDLQAKQSAAEAAKVSGAPVSETQHTQAAARLCVRNPPWPSWVTPSRGRVFWARVSGRRKPRMRKAGCR